MFLYHFIIAPYINISIEQCDHLSLRLDAYRLVFINGYFLPSLSNNIPSCKINLVNNNNIYPIKSEFFLHLIESLHSEIINLNLPDNTVENKPIYLLHISSGNIDKDILNNSYYRHNIIIGNNAQAKIVEHFVNVDENKFFNGSRTTIIVNGNAQLDYTTLITENNGSYHFSHNDFYIRENAKVCNNTFIIKSGVTRHQSSIILDGKNSHLIMNSLSLPSFKNHNYINTYLEHKQGYCSSSQLHRIILSDNGTGRLNGLIKVDKNSIKTNGKMINNNLLLSNLAKIDIKPQLEIYADDVKCSHGSTSGCLDSEQIFYLRTRGLSYKDSLNMIISAFAKEIIDTVNNNALRKILLNKIYEIKLSK